MGCKGKPRWKLKHSGESSAASQPSNRPGSGCDFEVKGRVVFGNDGCMGIEFETVKLMRALIFITIPIPPSMRTYSNFPIYQRAVYRGEAPSHVSASAAVFHYLSAGTGPTLLSGDSRCPFIPEY